MSFFSYACFFASLSEEWIDSTNLNRDEVGQDFVDILKETPELGLKLIRIAPDGLPKEKFAQFTPYIIVEVDDNIVTPKRQTVVLEKQL